MNRLKPCPFCGADEGNLYITSAKQNNDDTVGIFCNICKSITFLEINDEEGINGKTTQRAISHWNRRIDDNYSGKVEDEG